MGFFSNLVVSRQLHPGDHIYTWRFGLLYSHHGIYMGEGRVVHFTGAASSLSLSSSSIREVCSCCEMFEHSDRDSGVIVSCLDCFLDSGSLRRYEYGVGTAAYWLRRRGTCNTAESSAAVVVLERTESLLANNEFGKYNVLKNNCEDFATFCKTGQGCDRNGTARGYGQARPWI